MSSSARRLLTLDANVFVATLRRDEKYSDECRGVLEKIPDEFVLIEPSIVYQEVCGTLARRVGIEEAHDAKDELDRMVSPGLLVNCDKPFCLGAYPLCGEYEIYALDALYLKVALDGHAILVSLDEEDFIDPVKSKRPPVEVYHVSEFPY